MSKSNKKPDALYPYTLQPVALNMTESEFKSAQLALFSKSEQMYGIQSVRTKEWVVLAVVTAMAIAGLVFLNGYSTIIFWLMLAGVIIYLLARTIGVKAYMKREFDKQVASLEIPKEMSELKLGVQSHGLVVALPLNHDVMKNPQLRGMTMRSAPAQQAVIPWSAVSQWDETDDFIFVMFEQNGQKGSQIIPKRLANNHFPIATVIKHLSEVKAKGLSVQGVQ